MDLREQLCLAGRVCLIGIGNVKHGDDGVGVYLARALDASPALHHTVMVAGTEPEQSVADAIQARFDNVIFLDAVDFGGSPGETVFLDAREITARFPQLSTHRLSLGLLARILEQQGTKTWLLGVQPQSLAQGDSLTPPVQASLNLLRDLLQSVALPDPDPSPPASLPGSRLSAVGSKLSSTLTSFQA